jgi:PTH1 family peptidyl-tRNA hydrolase
MAIELVIGLGNPGRRYAATRHNAGFRVVDRLAERLADQAWIALDVARVVSTSVAPRLILAKPMTFMNRSADAVEWLLDLLEIAPDQMLIVVDDVDLGFGSLRLRPSGGPGTHNGLRSICSRVGNGFPRLRVGVRGDRAVDDLADYVLSAFDDTEDERMPEIVSRAADAVTTAVSQGVDAAMNRFNRVLVD